MQIIFVGVYHWCTVSNVECDDEVVNVYDSMYSSASSGTVKLIASLVFGPTEQLVVRMMDVGKSQMVPIVESLLWRLHTTFAVLMTHARSSMIADV